MATKPDINLSRWADTGSADKTTPSSGLRDTGFVEGTPADQSIVNELEYQHYLWAQYVNDGVFDGDLTVSGDLFVGALLVIADVTFTASAAADTITITGHGLQTGDGPVRVANSGGALPGGLVAATDYWLIFVDANTLKVADSLLHALAGTFIALSTDGTGTQTLSDTASTRRSSNATIDGNLAVNGSCPTLTIGTATVTTVNAGDIATTGDITVGDDLTATGTVSGADVGHGQRFTGVPSWAFKNIVPGATTPTLNDLASSGSPDAWTGWASGDKVIAWLPFDAGDTLESITWSYAKQASSAAMVLEVVVLSPTGSVTPIDTLTDTSSGVGFISTARTLNHTISGPPTVTSIGLRVSSSTAAHFFQNAIIVWHRTV